MHYSRIRPATKAAPVPILASDGSLSVNLLGRHVGGVMTGSIKQMLILGLRTPAPKAGDRFTLMVKDNTNNRIEAFRGVATSYKSYNPTFKQDLPVDGAFCFAFESKEDHEAGRMELGYQYWDGESESQVSLYAKADRDAFAIACGWRDWAAMHKFYARDTRSYEMRGTLLCWDELEILPSFIHAQ